jgi:hypothetical protein
MSDIYVYSTKTSATTYTFTKKGGGDLPVIVDSIRIEGGANVTNKNFITPLGVMTKITSEQLALLETHPVFKRHVENGFISVRKSKVDEEVAVADMAGRDKSAPLTDADFEEDKAPIVADDKKVEKKTKKGK